MLIVYHKRSERFRLALKNVQNFIASRDLDLIFIMCVASCKFTATYSLFAVAVYF